MPTLSSYVSNLPVVNSAPPNGYVYMVVAGVPFRFPVGALGLPPAGSVTAGMLAGGAAAANIGNLSGDLTGNLPNPAVVAAAGVFALSGTLTPPAMTGTVNDYAPAGIAAASAIRLNGGVADRNVSGIAGGFDGRVLAVINVGTTNNIVLQNQSSGSAGVNRFAFPTDISLPPSAAMFLRYDGVGNVWRLFAYIAAAATQVIRGYLDGLTLSNDGGNPNTTIGVATGVAADSSATVLMSLGTFTKTTAAAWGSGTGAAGMGNGLTVGNNTWYHVILANNNGVPDIYFDTSATGANRPAGITDVKVRRIGSFKTDGSAHILAFTQNGNEFLWKTYPHDITSTSISATAANYTLSVPLGVQVLARHAIVYFSNNVAAGSALLISSPDVTDQAPTTAGPISFIGFATGSVSPFQGSDMPPVRVNTSSQVRVRCGAQTGTLDLWTVGWFDPLGRNG